MSYEVLVLDVKGGIQIEETKGFFALVMVMVLAATNLSMQLATIQAAQKKTNVINLNVTLKQMYVGQKYTPKVKPSKASKAVNWKSSNKKQLQ